MDEFEKLLEKERTAIERFVKLKIKSQEDAEDVLQETYLTAFKNFFQLKNKNSFKAWVISIAKNKCNDYYRKQAKILTIPLDELNETQLLLGRYGVSEICVVKDTIELLGDKDKQMLYLYFFKEMPQAEIAKYLGIPLGTVKSRLYTAKQNFKEKYPYHTDKSKGEIIMGKLPEYMPEYTIEKSSEEPFSVKWEELMGWFIVPKLGEKLSWAMYDMPSRRKGEADDMEVIGKAEVHGIEGVEIKVKAKYPMDCNAIDDYNEADRIFIAQLTDTHCRILSESHIQVGVRKIYTFLDGDDFLPNWGFGEDNCGNETNLSVKGDIKRTGNVITTADKEFLLDVVGRYTVAIGGKSYDTICVMDINTYNNGVATEQFIDKNGRTILWRRFNRNDWAIKRYKKHWSEQLPENERITINGEIYVHWYDCITNYIF